MFKNSKKFSTLPVATMKPFFSLPLFFGSKRPLKYFKNPTKFKVEFINVGNLSVFKILSFLFSSLYLLSAPPPTHPKNGPEVFLPPPPPPHSSFPGFSVCSGASNNRMLGL
jgi:hypothetical protein